MTPRISPRRCKRCVHYQDGRCPIINLDSCEYDKDRPHIWIAVGIIVVVFAIMIFCSCSKPAPSLDYPKMSAVELLRRQHADELTPWQELQLAIIFTESRFNPDALGAAGDRGLYQMTPIYVAEVNRVAGTDYVPEDAFDPAKAVEIFSLMQDHYNPTHDATLALYYHHKGEAYRRAVLNNLETIRRYEAARKHITK